MVAVLQINLYCQLSAVDLINVQVSRDYLLDRPCLRGLKAIDLRVTLGLTVMLSMDVIAIRNQHSDQLQSLVRQKDDFIPPKSKG